MLDTDTSSHSWPQNNWKYFSPLIDSEMNNKSNTSDLTWEIIFWTCTCMITACCYIDLWLDIRKIFWLLEVYAMVVAVQQWLAARTTNFTVCRPIVEHGQPPCTVTIHKTCTDQQWNGLQNSFPIQDQWAIYVLTTNTSNTLISANRPRCGENLKKSWLATWLDIKRLTWTQLCLSLTLESTL